MTKLMAYLFQFYIGQFLALFANSTTIITDLTTVINNISAAQQSRGAGGSPVSGIILDPTGVVNLLKLKAQEMAFLLNYLLYGSMVTGTLANAGNPANYPAAVFQTGDSNAANTTTKLINVLTDLS